MYMYRGRGSKNVKIVSLSLATIVENGVCCIERRRPKLTGILNMLILILVFIQKIHAYLFFVSCGL